MRSRGLVLAVIAAGALTLSASPASADTLDQQQTATSTNGYIMGPTSGGPSSSAETFTAGLSGGLDQVDLFLNCFGCGNTVGVTVEIRDTSGGIPGTNVLATGSIPAANVGATGAFFPVTFSAPAGVQAGTQYAIVAYAGGSDGYRWFGASGTPYSGGHGFSSGHSPPTTWLTSPVTFAFRTYVNLTAGPTGQRAAALASCKKRAQKHRWSHKRLTKCKRRANSLPL